MKKQFFRLPESMSPQARSAFLIAILLAVPHFAAAAYYLYLGMSTGVAQFYALAGISFALGALFGIGALLSRRGQPTAGILLVLVPLAVSYPPIATLAGGLGLVLGLALMVAGPMMAFQVLPRRSAWVLTIVTVVSGLATLLLDVFGSTARPSLPGLVIQILAISVVGVLIFFLVRQAWGFISTSVRLEITVWTGMIVAILSIVLVAYSIINTRQSAIDAAEKQALAIADAQALSVSENLDLPMTSARTMAIALKGIKDPGDPTSMTRDQVNKMLYHLNVENPSFLGTYTLWEPNAFDGLDSQYKNAPAHDATGRFIPYWVRRADGSVTVESLLDYETPGIGDWYVLPRQQKKEMVFAPLVYPINNVETVMASFVVPIMQGDTFYGIAGVDAPISFVQGMVDSVDLYNGKANAILLTSSGTVIGFRSRPELVNQPATEVFADFKDLQPLLEKGEAFTSLSPDGKDLRVFSPVNIGNTGIRWSFGLIIPFSEITAQATASAIRQAAISIGLIILSLLALWYFTGQLVRPISELTKVANAITGGNLNAIAEIKSPNETGILATAFNAMTSQLRGTLSTLENRVAERTRNLELAGEVGRAISQVRALDVMLTDAAELIRKQFDLYYVQVYLADPSQTNLILQSGTGAVGAELIGRGHRLPLNTASINGRAAIEKRSVVISDTAASSTFKPNPLLPDTRSEMAVPLMIGERVVGVLDLQSQKTGELDQDILSAFEALAGQLAVAIQNANLLAETEQAREEIESLARRQSRANWVDYMDAIHKPEETGFVFEQNKITPMTRDEQSQPSTKENSLTAPIAVTGEALGNLVVEMEGQSPIARASELVSAVARQVAQQIESLRLLDSAERYRFEAEEASRRLTREGWKDYANANADQISSYIYDLKEVRPYDHNVDQQTEESAASLPLKVRDEIVGKLVIQGLASDDTESLELANAVAERLSAHIESLRQFDETQRSQVELDKRARQLAAVAEISTISSRELDIDKMLHSVVHLTQRQFGLYHAHVFIHNENTTELKIAACGWKEGDEREGTDGTAVIPLAQERSLVARAARTRQAVIVNDVHNESGWLPNPLMPDTNSEMAVPLIIGDQILGVLDVQSDILNAFSEEDANIYATLASQVSTALQNARSFAKSQQQAERESTLNLISQKIQSATTVEAVLQIAARELGHALGAPMTIAQLSIKDKK